MKAAVIGAGYLGRFHAQKYAAMEDVELIGVVDTDKERSRQVAAEVGSEAYTGLEDLIDKLDVASVVVPTTLHHQVASRLLENGIHVLVEKPMTTTRDEASDLIELAEKRSLVLQVGHLERYNPAVVTLEERVTRPLFIEAHRLSGFKERAIDVDVVLDLMIHDIDIVLALVKSSVKEIRAAGVPVLTKRVDIANVRLIFQNGCTANLTASRISLKDLRRIRIFQPGCYISADCTQRNNLIVTADSSSRNLASSIRPEFLTHEEVDVLDLELRDFIRSVKNGLRPRVDGKAGLKALSLALDINEAIDNGLKSAGISDVL